MGAACLDCRQRERPIVVLAVLAAVPYSVAPATVEVSPLEMATAYAVSPTGFPFPVSRVVRVTRSMGYTGAQRPLLAAKGEHRVYGETIPARTRARFMRSALKRPDAEGAVPT